MPKYRSSTRGRRTNNTMYVQNPRAGTPLQTTCAETFGFASLPMPTRIASHSPYYVAIKRRDPRSCPSGAEGDPGITQESSNMRVASRRRRSPYRSNTPVGGRKAHPSRPTPTNQPVDTERRRDKNQVMRKDKSNEKKRKEKTKQKPNQQCRRQDARWRHPRRPLTLNGYSSKMKMVRRNGTWSPGSWSRGCVVNLCSSCVVKAANPTTSWYPETLQN